MKTLDDKLNRLKNEMKQRKVKIMIIGLGSVGNYLLDFLMSLCDDGIEIYVVGRNAEKMQSDINIIKISSLIRGQNRTTIKLINDVDFNNISDITKAIDECNPDIIVNTSRAYSGLKYGSLSWQKIRAYGIWAPLAMKYAKNIMQAYEIAKSEAIVINASYSDAVIPWIKSAGMAYPDFGSGNVNHLIPRIKLAVASKMNITDYWNIDVTLATSHFHDVVISKEGQTEGISMLFDVHYKGEKIEVDDSIFSNCNITMPSDAKRNMMNAASNFEIIKAILTSIREQKKIKIHSPGIFGEIGGYPVIIDGSGEKMKVYICEDYFDLNSMRTRNRESIYLDGIEDIKNGVLIFSDELILKAKGFFNLNLVKEVEIGQIEEIANLLIKEIVEKKSAL